MNVRAFHACLLTAVFSCIANAQGQWALNTIGYTPGAKKLAALHTDGSDKHHSFQVLLADSEQVVFEGELTAKESPSPALADFSPVTEPGSYILRHGSTDDSPRFVISESVYVEPFRVVLQGMTLWRCGCRVEATHLGETFTHEACHLQDAFQVGEDTLDRDATGGWHDAGDYNKYVVNAGVTVGCMIQAQRDFGPRIEAAVGASLIGEIRWELDWLLKTQLPDGSVVHKVSTLDFGPFVSPEDEGERRYFSDWGTAATADFVAMTAAASRLFVSRDPDYAQRLRAAAERSHQFLINNPEDRRPDLEPFTTGGYQTRDRDDRLWALAEVWETTGDPQVLKLLELAIEQQLEPPSERRRRRGARSGFGTYWDWSDVANLGMITYLDSDRPGRSEQLVRRLQENLIDAARDIASTTTNHPYGRPIGERYLWGCNGAVARVSPVLYAADRIEPSPEYTLAAGDAVHHLFGRNPFARSYVTGLGHKPPMHPHDRRSGADDILSPWPGYLVGGPQRGPLDWRDEQEDYRTNEIAINWNAALIYALAAQLPSQD